MKPILNVEKVEKYYGSKSCLTKALDQDGLLNLPIF